MLYSDSAGCFLIGCLCNNPSLLRTGKYNLTMDDFEPNLLHKFLFAIINNLAFEGLEEITEIEIDQYSQPYKEVREVFDDEDALEFIHTVKQQAKDGTIDFYYNLVRKFSLLRLAKNKGCDITEIFDESKELDSQLSQLNNIDIIKILNYFESKVIDLKKEFLPNNIRKEMWVGDNFEKVLEQYETIPVMGAGLNSPYENAVWRGWQTGHLLMRSGGSGSGKTTRMVGDISYVCSKYIWDDSKNDFIKNLNYQGPGFYIHTEMNQELELQPKFLAYIANLPLSYILDGMYTAKHRKRLLDAADIFLDSKLKLIDLSNFTIPLLENTIKENAVVNNCHYGVFDYVEDNGTVGKVYKQEVGTALRSDMVLLAIVSKLKATAEDCGIGLLTGSQLNGNEKTNAIIDESCLSGSKAMKNKLDGGSIVTAPTKKELEQTRLLNQKVGFGPEECNMISHIYKGRFSQYGQNIKLFQKFDYGTGRIEDLYATNAFNEPINIKKIVIQNLQNDDK